MTAVTLLATEGDVFSFRTYAPDEDHMLSETQLKYDVARAASIVRKLDRGQRTTFILHQGA